MAKYNVTVRLVDNDGNAMSIIVAIAAKLRQEISPAVASEFIVRAFDCQSYDDLLCLTMETVDVI